MRCTCDQFRKTSYSCWVRPCTKALRLAVIYAFFGQTARTRCLVYVPAFVTFYLRALNKLWNLKTNRIFYPNRILRESDSIRDKFWVGTRRLCSWSLSNAISVVSLPLFIFIRMKRDTLCGGERRTVKRVASGRFLLLFFLRSLFLHCTVTHFVPYCDRPNMSPYIMSSFVHTSSEHRSPLLFFQQSLPWSASGTKTLVTHHYAARKGMFS